jgi:hypothetical protein
VNLSLFINTSEPDPRLALVTSKTDMTRKPLPIFTLGDQVNLTIYLVNGSGGIDGASGTEPYVPYLALGLPGHDSLADVSSFTLAEIGGDKCWTTALDLSPDELTMYVRSAVRSALTLIFLTLNATLGRGTWLTVDAAVADQVGAPSSVPVTTVPVAIVPRPDITALTGGTATDLDGVDDTTLPLGYAVILSYGPGSQTFQITDDPTAAIITDEDGDPVTIRVKNWNASTNSRYWRQI